MAQRKSLKNAEPNQSKINTKQHCRYLLKEFTLKIKLFLTAAIAMSLPVVAQTQTNGQTRLAVEPLSPTPVFRVAVDSRSVQAVNYKHRSGATKVDFEGTD